MAINFSLAKINKLHANGQKELRVYARAQAKQTISKEALVRYAAEHYTTFRDHNLVRASLEALEKATADMLRDGNNVKLGEFGTFYNHIDSDILTGAEYEEKGFSPSRNIKDVTVKWRPSNFLKSLKAFGELQFAHKPTVRNQIEKMKEVREREKPQI